MSEEEHRPQEHHPPRQLDDVIVHRILAAEIIEKHRARQPILAKNATESVFWLRRELKFPVFSPSNAYVMVRIPADDSYLRSLCSVMPELDLSYSSYGSAMDNSLQQYDINKRTMRAKGHYRLLNVIPKTEETSTKNKDFLLVVDKAAYQRLAVNYLMTLAAQPEACMRAAGVQDDASYRQALSDLQHPFSQMVGRILRNTDMRLNVVEEVAATAQSQKNPVFAEMLWKLGQSITKKDQIPPRGDEGRSI